MRRSEILRLLVDDIDFNRRTILVRLGEGDKDRVIPMAQRIVIALRNQCAGKLAQEKVFDGLNDASVWRIVTSLARACHLGGFHTHSLRYFFATQLVEKGANLRDVQMLLGHESLETTSVYLDIAAQNLRTCVDLLDGEHSPYRQNSMSPTDTPIEFRL